MIAAGGEESPTINSLPRYGEGYAFLRSLRGESEENAAADQPYRQFQGYVPSQALLDRLEAELPSVEQSRRVAHVPASGEPSLGSWAYPLTAFAMLLVAVACGQLVASRSLLFKDAGEEATKISRATERCLLFVVGLSVLDLICTLLALQAGVMHELNPLAGRLLGSPLALTAFKIGITVGGAALLYALRSHFPARRAAWWLCLICVLVTIRWVAFNSLFVA